MSRSLTRYTYLETMFRNGIVNNRFSVHSTLFVYLLTAVRCDPIVRVILVRSVLSMLWEPLVESVGRFCGGYSWSKIDRLEDDVCETN